MSDLRIGAWIKRKGPFRRHFDGETERWVGPRWHLVESVVAGAAVTRCGRRMEALTGQGPLEVRDTQPLTRMIGQPHLCKKGCDDRVGDGAPEEATETEAAAE